MLNEDQIQGKWKEIKGGIRNLWGKLTDDEIEQYKGKLTDVAGLVQSRYGETKEEIKTKLNSLMESFDNDTDKNISPDVSSYQRSPIEPRTSSKSQLQDSDIKTRSPERNVFDKKTFDAVQSGDSNYSGVNPGRETLDKNSLH